MDCLVSPLGATLHLEMAYVCAEGVACDPEDRTLSLQVSPRDPAGRGCFAGAVRAVLQNADDQPQNVVEVVL